MKKGPETPCMIDRLRHRSVDLCHTKEGLEEKRGHKEAPSKVLSRMTLSLEEGNMRMKIRNSRDFYAGLMFFFFGLLFLLVARNYPMGRAGQMGPGYFPTLLGGCLAFIGFAISAGAFGSGDETVKPLALGSLFRPLALVSVGVLAFAVMVRPLGLLLATLALVVVSSLGGSEFRTREVIGLFIVLAAISVTVFIYGFGLPLRVWP
jgi:hypothetical protein